MRFYHTDRSREQVSNAPKNIQRALDTKLRFLIADLRHPSLRAKKYDEVRDIWQARITKGWRFYFLIDGDMYIILSVTPHPK
ncbi:MAG: hypothetical protein A3C11_00055 [Candidatus Sungbacteria bacterium RIFCSPHIGHO2_02_FULL_49_12]|uniref:Type II toxin-antitoxin system RelE/ParE family toxin n=1 Tax=Candidatus Sungbacteria bacterium RIFCSPHIGHO2_02_FULL_49_12 TaxID=1802271 RepID=A0A1G2KUC7_9BACT|nr:MAG: hypothetical protein A3C11_00055 [Candidatus Sungbacteria bacterium RIFCSPHIGHO2_02_FULL_49_12]